MSTFTNINSAMVDERIVEALRSVRIGLDMVSHKVEDTEKQINNVVRVSLATDPTVGDKTAGTMGTATGSLVGVDVTLNKFRQAAWDAIEGEISPSQLPQYWADKAAGAVINLGHDVLATAFALVTAANYSNADADKLVSAPASFMQEDLGLLWTRASKKIKGQQKTFVMNADYAGAILSQPGLGLVFATTGDAMVKTGQIPLLMGMGVAQYNELPDNSESLGGFVIGKAAIAVAIAQPGFFLASGQGNIVDRRAITDPESGLSCTYTVTADGGGKMNGEVSILFGVAKAQNSIVRLVSAS